LVVSNTPVNWNNDQLQLVVSNAFGGTNYTVNLVVAGAPIITTNLPSSITLLANRYYSFSASVAGAPLLSYQWYKNNASIPGQTASSYSFVTSGQGTNTYYYVSTNNFGSVSSIVSTVTVVQSYQSMILSNGPVAYWPLDETPDNDAGDDGTVAHDISGNGNNMFYTNAVIGLPGISGDPFTVAQFGTFATSYSMAEESSATGVPDMAQEAAANNGNGEFTVEAWTAPTTANAVNDRIVDEGHFFGEEWALDLGATTPSTAFRFTVRDLSGGEHDARGTIVPDGNWHYVVGVCDEASGNVLLYVDGALNASNNFDAPISPQSGIEEDNQPITIGNADVSQTGVGQYTAQLIGKISDVAIYTNILTAAQIQTHYQVIGAGQSPYPIVTNELPVPGTNLFTLYAGVSPAFQAVGTGIGPFTYQWYSNGVAVAGATNTTLTDAKVQAGFLTNYCVISNPYDSSTSMVWAASVIAAPSAPFVQSVLANNPLAYWRLNETTGNIANDYAGGASGFYGIDMAIGQSGASLPGLPHETVVQTTPNVSSVIYGCITNDGVLLNTNSATFLCWAYLPVVQANPSGLLFCRSGSTVAGDQIGGSDGFDYTWNNLASTYDFSGPTVPLDTWTLVALTTTPNNAILYAFNANGVRVATNNVANALQSFTQGMNIGADPQAASRIFNGYIGEVAIFNGALSSNALSQLYVSANTASGPSFTSPPPISFGTTANNEFSLTWPSEYAGYYYLEVQTNKLSVGINTNWVPYGGSIAATLNSAGVTNNFSTNDCVFYRLMTNAP
ncbi:MAG: LamG-like jellyroll fold domain-containing protein, partial [Limisphaerales bacterium]